MDSRFVRRGTPGWSDGRSHTDEQGITWDDEGNGIDRAGNEYLNVRGKVTKLARRSAPPRRPAAPSTKYYHKVAFADREKAKAEGMRWDPEKKMWYHISDKPSAFPKA